MEEMYQKYKDIAEFRMIYIREAHAANGSRPVGYAMEMGLKEHTSLDDRCTTAQRLIDDKSLSIPMLIDGIDNTVNLAYSAHPDRVFLVGSDGRLAVAASRGPRGFLPGLIAAEQWLSEFEDTGEEPELTAEQMVAGDAATETKIAKEKAAIVEKFEAICGNWTVVFDHSDSALTAEVEVSLDDGTPVIKWTTSEAFKSWQSLPQEEMAAEEIRFDGTRLMFHLPAGDGSQTGFAGEFDGEKIVGELSAAESLQENVPGKFTWTRKQ